MEETPYEKPSENDLQDCFVELKKCSLSYKLGQSQTQSSGGDEAEFENPLHKQFSLILAKIDESLAKHSKDSQEYLRAICMKSSILYEKAKIFLSENLLPESRILLEQALNFISEFSEHPKVCFLYLRIINHLTYILSRLGELEAAKDLLLEAISVEEKCKPEVFSTDDLFMPAKKNERMSNLKLNRLTINNMQMLSWVYGKMGNTDLHLQVQHDILQKQLELPDIDIMRWAESCFRLGGIFIGAEDFENARYHLAAAESVLNPLEYSFVANPDLTGVQGELARSWVYYGLQLFDFSAREKIKALEEKIDQEGLSNDHVDIENSVPKNEEKPAKICYTFDKLEIEMSLDSVPCRVISNLVEAKMLFGFTQKWIKRARVYYTLRDFPLQYVNLSLDLSDTFRFLASYELDTESQYSVQKRRYDSLETLRTILKEMRPNCYLAVTVELTKEIIETQLEMMSLNMRNLYVPSEIYTKNYINNEDYSRRKMSALSSLHAQLGKMSLNLETNPSPRNFRDIEENNEKNSVISDEPDNNEAPQ